MRVSLLSVRHNDDEEFWEHLYKSLEVGEQPELRDRYQIYKAIATMLEGVTQIPGTKN